MNRSTCAGRVCAIPLVVRVTLVAAGAWWWSSRRAVRSIASLKEPAREPIRRGEAPVALTEGPHRLNSEHYGPEAAAWKAEENRSDRHKELEERVQAVVQNVLASAPPPDLPQRRTYAPARFKGG